MKKVMRAIVLIFLVISMFTLIASLGCFIYSIININEKTGLKYATGVILYFLFSPICIMSSIISLALTLIERLSIKDKINNCSMLYNELSIIFVVILSVITLVMN